MTRFYGEVGYGTAVESPVGSGDFEDTIVERSYYGEVIRKSRKLESGDGLNNDVVINYLVSIVVDQYALDYFFAIKYVRWTGTLWTVTNVEVKSPRLILTLGEVYNGPST